MSNIFEQALNDIPEDIQKDVARNLDVIDRIHYIMSKKGLTHHDLANLLGENELEISRWMRGTHDFTLSTIRRIEEKLGERILLIVPPGEEIKKSSATSTYHLSVTYNYYYYLDIINYPAKKDKVVKKFVGKMEYSIN